MECVFLYKICFYLFYIIVQWYFFANLFCGYMYASWLAQEPNAGVSDRSSNNII